jgi:hypothetical protein
LGTKHWLEIQANLLDRYKHAGDETYSVANRDLISVFAIHDRLLDLCDLYRAVYKALDGDMILVAQTMMLSASDAVITTVGPLSCFAPATVWQNITIG